MKLVLLSDSHGQHRSIVMPPGDIVLHAGDLTGRGRKEEVLDFLQWYSSLSYTYKVFIAGNHDFYFEERSTREIADVIPPNIIYLNDSGVTIEGLNIWGSPIQPWFFDWAFNRQRGADIRKHWDLIPGDTDVLITHGPPMGILDRNVQGEPCGCEDLLLKVKEVKPKLHLFGHIHEAAGKQTHHGTTFVNGSVLDARYEMKNEPVVWIL